MIATKKAETIGVTSMIVSTVILKDVFSFSTVSVTLFTVALTIASIEVIKAASIGSANVIFFAKFMSRHGIFA